MEIDYKKILEDLENKYEEIETQYREVRHEWIAEFEGTQDSHAYMSYTEDEVKKTMYPEWYEKEQVMKELRKKMDAFEKECENALLNVHKQLEESINKLEEKLKVNEDYIKGLDEKIEKQQKELDALKESEEYINGDEATRLQVEELEMDLIAKKLRRDKVMEDISSMKEQLTKLKEEKEQLVEKYGDVIESEEIVSEENLEDVVEPEEENKDEDDTKEDKSKGKNARASNGAVVYGNVGANPEEKAKKEQEEKAKKEQEEKDKKLKEDFTDLSAKAKKGKLTEKELEDFVEILKDKDNYEKLGLSMGLVFNKPRGIFKALNKKYKDDETKLASINEAYSVYKEKFFEKHGEKKLTRLSKIFEIDEVEHEKKTRELAAPAEEHSDVGGTGNAGGPLGAKLAENVVKDEDYVDISSSSRKKGELDRGEK